MDLILLLFTGAVFISVGIILCFCMPLIKNKAKIKEIWLVYLIQFLTMGAILIPAYFGGIVFTIAIGILATICLIEYLNIQTGPLSILTKTVCIAAGISIFVLAYFFNYLIIYISIPLTAIVLSIISIFNKDEKTVFPGIASALFGLIYISIFFSHIIFIRKMENGFIMIFFMYGVSEINDSFAYIFGTSFGKKKIFPHISPNKTYVGFFSGIITALIFSIILNHFITKFTFLYTLIAALIIIIFTILGDIISSKLKRALNVKDFSNLLPKVGGVLDIYDALIFISPVFFYFIYFTSG